MDSMSKTAREHFYMKLYWIHLSLFMAAINLVNGCTSALSPSFPPPLERKLKPLTPVRCDIWTWVPGQTRVSIFLTEVGFKARVNPGLETQSAQRYRHRTVLNSHVWSGRRVEAPLTTSMPVRNKLKFVLMSDLSLRLYCLTDHGTVTGHSQTQSLCSAEKLQVHT